MKATIKFELPEEAEEFELAAKASDIWCVLYDTTQEIRSALKYSAGTFGGCDPKTLEEIQQFIYSKAADRRIPEL
jgi:hypothetical protein